MTQWFAGIVFLLGAFVRVYDLDARSIWRDEAWVASLASSDSLSSVFFSNLPVPPLFISSVFFSVHLFENNEWFLRIIPVLFGIGAMVLIYYAVRQWLGKLEALGVLILFAFSPPLIVYARELKQYSGDLFFALLFILISEHLLRHKSQLAGWLLLAICGAVGLWFSYPAVFVLFAVAIATFRDLMKDRQDDDLSAAEKSRRVFCWTGTFSVIALSFIVLYLVIIRNQVTTELESYWQWFFPDIRGTGPFLIWFASTVWSFFTFFWNDYAYAVVPISLIGIWVLFRSGRSRILSYWGILFILLLTASFFHKYPFAGDRVTLFTIPFFMILFIAGLKAMLDWSRTKLFWKPFAYLGVLLFMVQVADAAVYYDQKKGYLWHTQYPLIQEMKPALSVLLRERKDGEGLYVYHGGDRAFEYYSKFYYKKSFDPAVIGKPHRRRLPEYLLEIKPLVDQKRPFWILATHVSPHEIRYIHRSLYEEWKYIGRPYFKRDGALLIYYMPQSS